MEVGNRKISWRVKSREAWHKGVVNCWDWANTKKMKILSKVNTCKIWHLQNFPTIQYYTSKCNINLLLQKNRKSRLSLPSRQMNTKKRNPWNPLKMTNRYWNTTEASLTVRAPTSHGRPNITINPTMPIRNSLILSDNVRSGSLFINWTTTNTRTTSINITLLKTMTTQMGARNVAKNTIGPLMKQL